MAGRFGPRRRQQLHQAPAGFILNDNDDSICGKSSAPETSVLQLPAHAVRRQGRIMPPSLEDFVRLTLPVGQHNLTVSPLRHMLLHARPNGLGPRG
ncbi:unnamed protein product [Protopolystoma xenopodis]|uniref:Uncharacterized protein n=1 Tax=Protopolystoma xenopodis TaxID=117903 RepID=A0A448XMI5_9PLAT|nr:unnamed protein product [Protopolystoma xenopodis]